MRALGKDRDRGRRALAQGRLAARAKSGVGLEATWHARSPNGYCSKGCAVSDCTEGFCYSTHMGTTTTSLCMVSCTSDADCRMGEGYRCAVVGFGVGVCDL